MSIKFKADNYFMKKFVFHAAVFLFNFFLAAQTPESIRGIWKGSDRYVFFGPENQIAVILKTYYGWYYDRAAEPVSFLEMENRTVNAATAKEPRSLSVNYRPLSENAQAWEIAVNYGNNSQAEIPAAVIGNNMYFDFLLRLPEEKPDSDFEASGDHEAVISKAAGVSGVQSAEPASLYGFWQGVNAADAFRISERNDVDNVISWYVADDAVYRLRYWKTDMDYDPGYAVFTDGSLVFHIRKHIKSGGAVYTCVNGRSSRIRNVEKSLSFFSEYNIDSSGIICAYGKPYLTKIEGKSSAEELLQIVKEANSRRKPDPPPLFPPEELDWHWDLINQLEKDNEQVQAVRERQKQFGPRGKETAE